MHMCDGFKDCATNEDERDCPFLRYISYEIKPPAVINFNFSRGFTVSPLPENNTLCPDTHFQCHDDDGYCLPVYVRCNGIADCAGHEDEAGCESYKTCPGFYRCRSYSTVCVHVSQVCDGLSHCPLHDDEQMCFNPCPESCVCHHSTFFCNRTFPVSLYQLLRYLDASGTGMHVNDVAHNIYLIHLGAQACGLTNLSGIRLPNLHSVDLSRNVLRSVNFDQFAGMPQLQRLNLAGNPISYVQLRNVHPSLVIVNMSHVEANYLNLSGLSTVMPNLQILDLSWTEMQVLQEQGMFHDLQVLNLLGCPITEFNPEFMKHMTNLMHVSADNYKLCCSVVLPDSFQGQCLAPFDEISSCDNLLKSIAYRCSLAIFAIVAVLGNFGGFVYRVYHLSESTKTGFVVFVIHLCASDFLMGVYLAFIGVADQIYAGNYIWNETSWKKSSACSIAGFLSLLSSEISAVLICFITLDRFLVLRFPFSSIRFGTKSAHISCILMWALGFALAMVPLLPVTSHWEFFHQTGICIPLPVTRTDFPGQIYSFSIMIVGNLVLFLMIGVGQFLIYCSVRSNSISNQLMKTRGTENAQSNEAAIAMRLLSVAVSDFLCWFPIGLCGVLAASGVVIPGEVNVGLAIFVLPLNSALNPFLYTLNVLLEKRRKAQELRFLKLLLGSKGDT